MLLVVVVMLLTKAKVLSKMHGGALRINEAVSQPERRSSSVAWWYGNRYFCISCQMAAG